MVQQTETRFSHNFNDLCVKLVAYFSTSIPAKKNSTKRLNKECLKLKT
jgi:hypothetical protein